MAVAQTLHSPSPFRKLPALASEQEHIHVVGQQTTAGGNLVFIQARNRQGIGADEEDNGTMAARQWENGSERPERGTPQMRLAAARNAAVLQPTAHRTRSSPRRAVLLSTAHITTVQCILDLTMIQY